MTDQKTSSVPKEKNLANKVIELIINDCELVHNRQKEPFAIVGKTGVRQVYSVNSKSFCDWVASRYYASKKSALSLAWELNLWERMSKSIFSNCSFVGRRRTRLSNFFRLFATDSNGFLAITPSITANLKAAEIIST